MKNNLYDLYGIRNKTYIIPIVTYVLIKDIIEKGFTISSFFGILSTGFLYTGLFFFIYLISQNPYSFIENMKRDNPKMYEACILDFEQATQRIQNVWQGKSFYFFQGRTKFLPVPIGQIQKIEVEDLLLKGIGPSSEMMLYSALGQTKVVIPHLIASKEEVITLVESLKKENNLL